jgi:hypothetical protein
LEQYNSMKYIHGKEIPNKKQEAHNSKKREPEKA